MDTQTNRRKLTALLRLSFRYRPLVCCIAFFALLVFILIAMGQGSSSPDQDQDEVKVRVQVDPKKVPIVYSDAYNIGFWNIEKLHPFDSRKYEKVFNGLLASKMLTAERFYKPYRVSDQELLRVHTQAYLDSLKSSTEVARIIEVPPVAMLPNGLVQTKALDPMRYATGGTLVASELALYYGWAINLSGGYHHASAEQGGGFCVFADISLALLSLHQAHPELTRFMIVDLDAHQGNGHGTDKVNGVFQGLDVHIFDMYNHKIYPRDHQAAQGIDTRIKLEHHIDDRQYLELLRLRLEQAVQSHKPQFILYNAGTDCLIGDPLGVMDITAEGIMARDEIVFATALAGKIPVAMVLSGGYQKNNAAVITESILNLNEKHNLFGIQPKL